MIDEAYVKQPHVSYNNILRGVFLRPILFCSLNHTKARKTSPVRHQFATTPMQARNVNFMVLHLLDGSWMLGADGYSLKLDYKPVKFHFK